MSIPLQEPPGPACRLKSPICLFLWGLWGAGRRGWNASNRALGPLSQSSLITAPPQPPQNALRHHRLPETQPQWTWARVNHTAALRVCVTDTDGKTEEERDQRPNSHPPQAYSLTLPPSCQGIPASQEANTGQWAGTAPTEPITNTNIPRMYTCFKRESQFQVSAASNRHSSSHVMFSHTDAVWILTDGVYKKTTPSFTLAAMLTSSWKCDATKSLSFDSCALNNGHWVFYYSFIFMWLLLSLN